MNNNPNETMRERNRRRRAAARKREAEKVMVRHRIVMVIVSSGAIAACGLLMYGTYRQFLVPSGFWPFLAVIFLLTCSLIALWTIYDIVFSTATMAVLASFIALRYKLQAAALCVNSVCHPNHILITQTIGSVVVVAGLILAVVILNSVSMSNDISTWKIVTARVLALIPALAIILFGCAIWAEIGYLSEGKRVIITNSTINESHEEVMYALGLAIIGGGARMFYKLMQSLDDK